MYLDNKEKSILGEFRRRIVLKFPNEVAKILIFGSKARGDADSESDIDILVVTRSDDRNISRIIRYIGYELEIENTIIMSIQVFPEKYYNYLLSIPTQFISNIEKESIPL
ncbi:MAG: nucleotidyltransferase domain-containing protein [Candidatus Margulisiibacteriota bacterium]